MNRRNVTLIKTAPIFVGIFLFAALISSCWISQAMAQDPGQDPGQQQPMSEQERLFRSIDWQKGPSVQKLGTMAEIEIPDGYVFTATRGANIWLKLNQNLPDPGCLGIVMPKEMNWTLYFDFEDIGYVKDDEKDDLDADALLSQMSEATEQSNEYRKQKGWTPLHVDGWAVSPHYDPQTNNLVWGLKLRSEGADGNAINYDTRLLGRHGVMSVTLVANADNYEQILPTVETVLKGFRFVEGEKYSQWEVGDKVAKYGLTGLIAGGAAFAAVKTGLFAKLFGFIAKAGKAIVIGVVAIFAWLVKLFTGRRSNK